ncbi:MAG: hypothetical protein V4561_03355 [Bacteroidota bacterium]
MGLFSFFNRKDNNSNIVDNINPATQQNLPEIPENIFLEKDKPQNNINDERTNTVPTENGINLLFLFLEKNHEGKGYDDALVNPDNTHLEQNIEALKNDLERTIKKLKIFYEDFIREIDFHIGSRSRSGMVDTVEELTVKKETAENHIKQILEIENEAKNNKGVGQGVIISYTRGFKNGLAAISHHSIMKRTF